MRSQPELRILAIDWSGALSGASQKIWLAEVVDGILVRLENGRDREQMARHLVVEAKAHPRMVIGLDFAFSLPAWFLEANQLGSARELWALADDQAEHWLATCAWPFWGRPGVGKPVDIPEHFRQADREVLPVQGISPKSVFQIGGAGAVGTGSLRGMRLLDQLHAAGFSIWPFDPPGWPRVVEIYPRALTGAVVKTDPAARAGYLVRQYPDLGDVLRLQAAFSDDAFDAAVSALLMAQHVEELEALQPTTDATFLMEGRIWLPPGLAMPMRPATRSDQSRPVWPSGLAAGWLRGRSPPPPARVTAAGTASAVGRSRSVQFRGFVVGGHYENSVGRYEVLTIADLELWVRYGDGRLATLSIPVQTRIQERLGRTE